MRLRAKDVLPDVQRRGLGARGRGPGGGGRDASSAPPPARPFWHRCASVTTRTTSKTVTFRRPFVLKDFACLEPAGDYRVDTEEEQLDSLLVAGWRRVSTIMRVQAGGAEEARSIDPEELHEALMRDGAQDDPAKPPSHSSAKSRFARARKFTTYPARAKKC